MWQTKLRRTPFRGIFFILLLSLIFPTSALGYFNYETDRQKENAHIDVSTDESSGAFTLSYPIAVSPGRNGLEPKLALTYNSSQRENVNQFGYGWSINIPSIERINKKGVPTMYSESYFSSTFDGELATTTSGNYGAKVDNGSFLKYEYVNSDYWRVTDKEGTVYKFGTSTKARQYATTTAKTFKWMLEEVRDPNGNYISYAYATDTGQIYPSRITYTGNGSTGGIFEVQFTLESRSDHAPSYATGFSVASGYRVSEIKTLVNNNWVRKYTLAYTTGDNGVRSLLSSITETGQDESGAPLSLPPTEFTYQRSTKSWTQNTSYSSTTIPVDFVDGSGSDVGVRFMDANGDGLTDIIKGYQGNNTVYLNSATSTKFATTTMTTPRTLSGTAAEDYSTRLMEVNGDGLTDIVQAKGYKATYQNNGNDTGWSDTGASSPINFDDPTYNNDKGIRIMDINGDGLDDITYAYYNQPRVVYRNTGIGTGWTTEGNYTIPFEFANNTGDGSGWRADIYDINADGLPDLTDLFQSPTVSYINNGDGTGWTSDVNYSVPAAYVQALNDGGQVQMAIRVFDVNADGLPDFVRSDNYCSSCVYLNKYDGTGWTSSSGYSIPELVTGSVGSKVDTGMRVMDVNGDGLPDLVYAKDNTRSVYMKDGEVADLMIGVFDSKGKRTTIAYKGTPEFNDGTNLLNPKLRTPFNVASTIVTNDGNSNIATTTYTYGGGLFYYASQYDKKFAGFATTTETDALGNVTKKYFHQGDTTNSANGEYQDHISKVGKPYRIEAYDASNNLYSKTINKWDNVSLGDGRNFVFLRQTIEMNYDGNSDHRDTAKAFAYDSNSGSLTENGDWGEVTGSDNGTLTDLGTDRASTTITYVASTSPSSFKSQETTIDIASTTVKQNRYYYDNLGLGSVDKGNLTKQENWITGSTYASTTKTYNTYGLVTQEKDPRSKATNYVYDAFNLYVGTSTNPLSQKTEVYYDYSSGAVKKTTDPNGRNFETTYDALDRKTAESIPDITTPTTLVTKTAYTYTDARPASVLQTNYLSAATSTLIYTYFDGFGRKIQERTEAEDANTFAVKDFVYDLLGRPKKESLLYFTTGTASSSPTAIAALYSNYIYDALGRVKEVGNAVGTTTTSYDQWKATTTDALSHSKDLTNDSRGNLVQVNEYNGASTYTTQYGYNLLGNLTKITDALSNIRNFTYDGLGRRLTAEDLHASGDTTFGTTTSTYDVSGNVTQILNPNWQYINYTYDDINRVKTEDNTSKAGTEVFYSYDYCTEGIGHLCSATTTDGVTNSTYYATGATKSERKTIDGTDYTTQYSYDRMGNQTLITYPDNSLAQYNYNSAGQLESVSQKESGAAGYTDVITVFDYSPLGQITYQKFKNGVETTNTYDDTKLYRLTAKTTVKN